MEAEQSSKVQREPNTGRQSRQVGNGTEWKPRSVFTDEELRKAYEHLQAEYGTRYFAYALGQAYFQDSMNSDGRSGSAGFTTDLKVVQAFLPEVMREPELAEIFSTAYELRAKVQRIHNEIFNQGRLFDTEFVKQKQQEAKILDERIEVYERQLKATSKPASSSEQRPSLPRLCMEGVKYEIRSEIVPPEHKKDCPICATSRW